MMVLFDRQEKKSYYNHDLLICVVFDTILFFLPQNTISCIGKRWCQYDISRSNCCESGSYQTCKYAPNARREVSGETAANYREYSHTDTYGRTAPELQSYIPGSIRSRATVKPSKARSKRAIG